MSLFYISAHSGINKRFPEHKLVGKEKQFVQELTNMIDLDGETRLFKGGSRFADTPLPADIKWAKKIYYAVGKDLFKDQFVVSGGKFYKGNESTRTFGQAKIDNTFTTYMNPDFFPIGATMKVADQVSTFLCDGEFLFKFNSNIDGNWEKIPKMQDVDGNEMDIVFICEYLDRLWFLVKNRNILIFSKNLNPENTSDSTDAGIIDLSPGKGGFPQALIVHNGFLHVVHEDYIVPVTGSSVSTFGVRPGDYLYGHGTRAPRSVITVDQDFAFLNATDNELYLYSDLNTPLSYAIKLGALLDPVKAWMTVAHLDTTLNCIRVSYVPTGEFLLNAECVYSRDEKKWCAETRDRHISCYSQWNGNGDDGRMMTGRSDTGVLMWEDESLSFDSSAIHYKWVGASYVADKDALVQFERFELDAKAQGDFTIPLSYYLDTRITTNGVAQINNQGEYFSLGLISIGDQKSFLNTVKPLINRRKGRMIRFQFEETITNRKFAFYGINVEFTKDNRMFSKYIPGRS